MNNLVKQPHEKELFGHPVGLYVLFFVEMWERFSYYGMRALLILYMVSELFKDLSNGEAKIEALGIYGSYTAMVYLSPVVGGLLADKVLGYRKAVIIGAFVMTLGHAAMALEVFNDFFLYLGLICLIIGNGLFKPNISSIVGQLYKTEGQDKDAGYTIFYMGINVGAAVSAIVVGYIGEVYNWHYGFGLAGIGMAIGQFVYWKGQKYLSHVGNMIELDSTEKKSENLFLQIFKHFVNCLVLILSKSIRLNLSPST